MELLKTAIGMTEKLMKLPFFLLAVSVVLFADTYLLLVHGVSIRQVDDSWLQQHNALSETLTFLGSLGFFYAAVIPSLQFFVGMALLPFSETPTRANGWIGVWELKSFAVRTKNALAYQECEKAQVQTTEARQLQSQCLSLVLLATAGYVVSGGQNLGLAQFLYEGWRHLPVLQNILLAVGLSPFIGFVLAMAFRTSHQFDGYVQLLGFDSWEEFTGPDKATKLLSEAPPAIPLPR